MKKEKRFKKEMQKAMSAGIAAQLPQKLDAPAASKWDLSAASGGRFKKGGRLPYWALRMPKWAKQRLGLRGLGEDYSDIISDAQASGLGQFLVPSEGEVDLPAIDGLGSTSGFLSMGDMDTVEQPMDAIDITQDWATDEMFGEPLGI